MVLRDNGDLTEKRCVYKNIYLEVISTEAEARPSESAVRFIVPGVVLDCITTRHFPLNAFRWSDLKGS